MVLVCLRSAMFQHSDTEYPPLKECRVIFIAVSIRQDKLNVNGMVRELKGWRRRRRVVHPEADRSSWWEGREYLINSRVAVFSCTIADSCLYWSLC